MTQEATQIEVPNVEATTDGKKIFTPKQWLERVPPIHKTKTQKRYSRVNARGTEMTQNDRAAKETQIEEDFIWAFVQKPYIK